MATTTPDGIYYPISTDQIAPLETVFTTLATSVQTALTARKQITVATASALGALTLATYPGFLAYVTANGSLWYNTGTKWQLVNRPIVASSAARDALYSGLATVTQGDIVFRNDTGWTETYYGLYNSSTNPGGKATAGWYGNSRDVGLVPIVPPTTNLNGGAAVANTLALIPFTAANSTNGFSLNNCFTSAYDAYKVIIKIPTTSAAGSLQFKFRNAGSDITLTNYFQTWLMNRVTGATHTNNGGSASSVGLLQWSAALTNDYVMWTGDIIAPATVTKKNIFGKGFGSDATSAYVVDSSGMYNAAAAFDGMTISPSAGTITGTIQIFGYNN